MAEPKAVFENTPPANTPPATPPNSPSVVTPPSEVFTPPTNTPPVVTVPPVQEPAAPTGVNTAEIDALKQRLADTQAHVKLIETENADLRVKDQVNVGVQAVLKRMETPPIVPSNNPPPQNPPASPEKSLSEADIVRVLDGREALAQQDRNQQTVRDALSKHYGEKASDVYFQKAKDLSLSADQLNAMAANSATAVLAMFSLNTPPNVQSSSIVTTNNTGSDLSIPPPGGDESFDAITNRFQANYKKNPRGDGALLQMQTDRATVQVDGYVKAREKGPEAVRKYLDQIKAK